MPGLAGRTFGGVVSVDVVSGGSGYTKGVTISFTAATGTGAAAIANMAGGAIESVVVTNSGTGYVTPPVATINAATGSGATVAANIFPRSIDLIGVRIANGGAKYTSGATITSNPTVSASPVIDKGVVFAVTLNQGITSYSTVPTLTVSDSTTGGTGAEVYALTRDAVRPMSFFQGRGGEVYGVDGMGRGIRWDGQGSTAYPIGLARPIAAPAVTATSTSSGTYVSSIQMVRAGAGYNAVPEVTLTGGTPGKTASARAQMSDGRIDSVTVVSGGRDFQAAPAVSFSGGFPGGESFKASVLGSVDSVEVVSSGSGYSTEPGEYPSVVFSSGQGLAGANAWAAVGEDGSINEVIVAAGGTGATTTGVTASVVGGSGSGAVLKVNLLYRVSAVSVVSGGTGHQTPPVISFIPNVADSFGSGAAATASISNGSISSVTVYAGGAYSLPPSVTVLDTQARAVAVMSKPIVGKYLCAVRYLDSTPPSSGGPLPSSISNLAEIDSPAGVGAIQWTFTHGNVDDRVAAMELWRTTSDQAVVLYRVATILRDGTEWSSGYTDTLTDQELLDVNRSGYGLMPITLPSGQINARRFEVPPGNYAVGVMFQDRAWYAVDTTGKRPNSLLFSEVDEPESVPLSNELVVQENAGEHDSIVALMPMGSQLLIAQTGHLYALQYVAQPVLDASISLVAYRGILNSACWTAMDGVAFVVDSHGMYAYDGNAATPLSEPIEDYWRNSVIDFLKQSLFHVSADVNSKVVRFHYCRVEDSEPLRALCYCVATKAWWEEVYPRGVTAACEFVVREKRTLLFGDGAGVFRTQRLGPDENGLPVNWQVRTGNMRLATELQDRSIGVLYTPTVSDNSLAVSLHYNNSASPRPNAISTDRGSGFTTSQGDAAASLNMKSTRSPIGIATGYARAMFSGALDPNSAGGDRHVAVAMAGTQSSEPVRIHSVTVSGVT